MSQRLSSTLAVKAPEPLLDRHTPVADTTTDFKAKLRRRKFDDLLDSLDRHNATPARAWGYYADLLEFLGYEKLPLEIHQRVLRKCAPPTHELRSAAARRLQAGNVPKTPHIYESRFRVIIRNMRAAGLTPALEDYNFILGQFAAVGHHEGVVQVLTEMGSSGVPPDARSYALGLQAIAHRLTLPCPEDQLAERSDTCSQMSLHIVRHMTENAIPITSAIADLETRIIKDTGNQQLFESVIEATYGVNLEYPDSWPLKYSNANGRDEEHILHYQPLTASSLNTIIDFLGRSGRILKMVQAFEVLTSPLRIDSNTTDPPFDDEDDDFSFQSTGQSTIPLPLPHAQPNITSFNFAIRHASRAMHKVFARHYALQAKYLDRKSSARLQHDIQTKPLAEIRRPSISVNRGTFLPILGLANRDRDLPLMKWLLDNVREVKKCKRRDLAYFTDLAGERLAQPPSSQSSVMSNQSGDNPHSLQDHTGVKDDCGENFQPARKPPSHPLDIDIDSTLDDPPSPPKPFHIILHVKLLLRDLNEIRDLEERVKDAYLRLTERRKERLGRRVWAGKDIYMSDSGRRQLVSREFWKDNVNFLPARMKPSPSKAGGDAYAKQRALAKHYEQRATVDSDRKTAPPVDFLSKKRVDSVEASARTTVP
ncbi:hypothetical protein BD410DRAFT_833606 [Rickenella mellea]|uniref:Pentacotripeptide-repeat region of PRORP domain-containing protein n=1 Tax=Rickenella mellea TaxID=50990 RepID=A0A4R5XDW1_9AGAM|nr:hypothetical protein BD410DRAFT_833606 [Rickenella mellea]